MINPANAIKNPFSEFYSGIPLGESFVIKHHLMRNNILGKSMFGDPTLIIECTGREKDW